MIARGLLKFGVPIDWLLQFVVVDSFFTPVVSVVMADNFKKVPAGPFSQEEIQTLMRLLARLDTPSSIASTSATHFVNKVYKLMLPPSLGSSILVPQIT